MKAKIVKDDGYFVIEVKGVQSKLRFNTLKAAERYLKMYLRKYEKEIEK